MTEFVPIAEIDTSNRQRRVFDEMKIFDLAESIDNDELLHAPVLVGDTNVLLAGERRLRAMEMLHTKGIMFTYLDDIVPAGMAPVVRARGRDALALKEAELAENLQRQDLSWQERAAAEKELHDLRLQQTPTQTLGATAKELKGAEPTSGDVTRLSENILLAKHLDDPEIAKEKDRKTAMRKILVKEQKAKRQKVAEELKLSAERDSPHRLYHGAFEEIFKDYDGELFDLVLTDPPYGVGADEFHSQFTLAHEYSDSEEEWHELMEHLAKVSFCVTKAEAHAFVFCDISRWDSLRYVFKLAGWTPWERPLIWDKGSIGALPKPKHGPRLCYEAIMFASKGGKEVLKNGRDVLTFQGVDKTRHAAEKPIPLYVELIERTAAGGSWILDPFAGSGTIFPAATLTGCRAVGIEKSEDHYNTCLTRICE